MDKWSGARVIRPNDMSRSEYEREHYGVSKEEYEMDVYPTYCGGPCTLLSGETIQKSYETARVTNPGKFTMEGLGSNSHPAFKKGTNGPDRAGLSWSKASLFDLGLRHSLHRYY